VVALLETFSVINAASEGNVHTGIGHLLNLDSKIARNTEVIILSAGGISDGSCSQIYKGQTR